MAERVRAIHVFRGPPHDVDAGTRPGMTEQLISSFRCHVLFRRGEDEPLYFTSAHPPSAIGRNAWSAGIVETSR